MELHNMPWLQRKDTNKINTFIIILSAQRDIAFLRIRKNIKSHKHTHTHSLFIIYLYLLYNHDITIYDQPSDFNKKNWNDRKIHSSEQLGTTLQDRWFDGISATSVQWQQVWRWLERQRRRLALSLAVLQQVFSQWPITISFMVEGIVSTM